MSVVEISSRTSITCFPEEDFSFAFSESSAISPIAIYYSGGREEEVIHYSSLIAKG
jgi:hypothetical protein